MGFTSEKRIAPHAHFDAIASDLAHTGVLSGHLDAWHAACAHLSGEFTLVHRSFHSIYVGPTVNGIYVNRCERGQYLSLYAVRSA